MADIELVHGEYGFNYDITIEDPEESDGLADLSGYNTLTLKIKSQDLATEIVSKTLSQTGDKGIARWSIVSGDVATLVAGDYVGQIIATDSGSTVLRKTYPLLSVFVGEKTD